MSPQYPKKFFNPRESTTWALVALVPIALAACSIVVETAAPDSSSAASPRARESAYQFPLSHFAAGPDTTSPEPSVAAPESGPEHAGHGDLPAPTDHASHVESIGKAPEIAKPAPTTEPAGAHDVHVHPPPPSAPLTGHEAHQAQTPSVAAVPAVEALEYTCPVHPEVHQHEPGECPICGMTWVARKPHRDGER